MAKTMTLLKVFVASPGDVAEEREILEEVVDEINTTWGDAHSVRLELVKWETHTRPGFGEDAQDVINKQVGDNYDIFLGIMWGRFGSPTARAESGTEEEFQKAFSLLKSSSEISPIMFYFKDAGIPPSKMDTQQLTKIQEFKGKIASKYGGLYHEFENVEEFRTKVRIHLSKLMQDWPKDRLYSNAGPTAASAEPDIRSAGDPLANLAALTDDDLDEGLIELSERSSGAMEALVGTVENISDATYELSNRFEQRTDEVNQLMADGSRPDIKTAKRVSNKMARDVENYVRKLSVEIPEFQKHSSRAMDAFGKIAIISNTDLEIDSDDAVAARGQIKEYQNTVSSTSDNLRVFRDQISSMPRMTSEFNRARKRATAILDDFLVQLRITGSQARDVEQLLERLIDSAD